MMTPDGTGAGDAWWLSDDPLHEPADEVSRVAGEDGSTPDGRAPARGPSGGSRPDAPGPVVPPPQPRTGATSATSGAPTGPATPVVDDAADDVPDIGPGAEDAGLDVAYAGEGWSAREGEMAAAASWEYDVDTTLPDRAEMTGLWLFPRERVDSPLWMDGEPIDPDEIGVPPLVADRLRDWAQMWTDEWDPDRGWAPRARIDDFEALGQWLARQVKDAAGATSVTLQLPHLGRLGTIAIPPREARDPLPVTLTVGTGRTLPVLGDFVTEFGVGSFSSETNARLESWGRAVAAHARAHGDDPSWTRTHEAEARRLAEVMAAELGPDYRVGVDLDG